MEKNDDLKKERRRLRRKRDIRYATTLGLMFAATTTIVYFAIPNTAKGTEEVGGGSTTTRTSYVPDDTTDGFTPVQKFTSNLTSVQGLTAKLTANVSYPNNNFGLDSTIAFSMPELALDKIGLNLKANLTYNGTAVTVNDGANADTLDLDMLNGSLYVSAMGINYKSEVDSRVDFMKSLIRIFDIQSANIDLDSMSSSLTSGDSTTKITSALSQMKEEDLSDGTYRFTLNMDNMTIVMTADKNCLLTGAYTLDSNPLSFGDWKIGFNLSEVTMSDNITIVDPEASGKKKYYEINDSTKLIEKLYNVYKGKNVGISIEAALTNGTADEALSGSANVDFSAKSFMDDYLDVKLDSTYSYFAKSTDAEKTKDSQSLGAVYTPEAAYLTYNDALKAKMSHGAMASLVDSMKAKFGQTETKSATTAFDFVTQSPLMKDIYDGHYEKVLTELKKITVDDNSLKISVSLDQLGLGSDSEVVVTLNGNDATETTPVDLASIAVHNLTLSSAVKLTSATFKTVDYSTSRIDEAKAGTGYLSLDFAGGVFNQIYDLANTQKFGLTINSASDKMGTNGTVIEETGTNTKFVLSGSAQADIKNKVGTGHIQVVQTSKDWSLGSNGAVVSQIHDITADMTAASASAEAKLLFSYSNKLAENDKPLNGDLSVASIEDIVSQVKDIFSPTAPDQRWVKFLDGVKAQAAETVIGRLMKKDFGALLESKILKSVTNVHNAKTAYDEIKAVVDGHLIGDDGHDIVVYLPLGTSASNTDEVKGLRLENFVYQKYTINVDLSLNSYNDKVVTSLTEDSSYVNFSSLKTLVKFGIKTSYLTSFHLSAKMSVSGILNISLANIPVDFYLSVVDKTVKVSGHFRKIPLNNLFNNDASGALWDTLSMKSYRNVDFYYQAPASGGNGGNIYFYEYNHLPISGDTTVVKKVYAPYFVENILKYILVDVLNMNASYAKSITSKSATGSKQPITIEKVLNSYTFTDGTTPSFGLSLNTAVLANNSQLGNMDLTINTNTAGYLSGMSFSLAINIPILSPTISATVTNANIGGENWVGIADAETAWNSMMARTSFDSVEGY
jgi:hypothetical protein